MQYKLLWFISSGGMHHSFCRGFSFLPFLFSLSFFFLRARELHLSYCFLLPSCLGFASFFFVSSLRLLLFCRFHFTTPPPYRDDRCQWLSPAPFCPSAHRGPSVFNELCVCGSQPEAFHWPVGICFSLPPPVSPPLHFFFFRHVKLLFIQIKD